MRILSPLRIDLFELARSSMRNVVFVIVRIKVKAMRVHDVCSDISDMHVVNLHRYILTKEFSWILFNGNCSFI